MYGIFFIYSYSFSIKKMVFYLFFYLFIYNNFTLIV